MAGSLTARVAFGVNGTLRGGNAAWVDDTTLVYSVGGYIVRLNTITRAQEFAPLLGACDDPTASCAGITALAVSPSRRYVAVAERCTDSFGAAFSIVSVFSSRSLARRKVFTTAPPQGPTIPLGSGAGARITALAFSSDDLWLAAVGHAPEWTLGIFSMDKVRVATSVSLSADAPTAGTLPLTDGESGSSVLPFCINGVSFSPSAPSRLCVFGTGYVRFFSLDVDKTAGLAALYAATKVATDAGLVLSDNGEVHEPEALEATHLLGTGTPLPDGALPPPAPRTRTKREREVVAAAAAAASASKLASMQSHALHPLPPSSAFLAYLDALRDVHVAQARRRLGESREARRGAAAARLGLPAIAAAAAAAAAAEGEGGAGASVLPSSVVDYAFAEAKSVNSDADEDAVVALHDEDDIDAAVGGRGSALTASVDPSMVLGDAASFDLGPSASMLVAPPPVGVGASSSSHSIRRRDLVDTTPAAAAIAANAAALATASSVPALAWLTFTSCAWVVTSGPVNVPSGVVTDWTPAIATGVCVFGTAAGDIVAFREGEFLAPLPNAPRDGAPVHCIAPYARGFLTGSAGGAVRVFELLDPAFYRADLDDAAETAAAARGLVGAPSVAGGLVARRAPGAGKGRLGSARRSMASMALLSGRTSSARGGSARSIGGGSASEEGGGAINEGGGRSSSNESAEDESSVDPVGAALGVAAFFIATRTLHTGGTWASSYIVGEAETSITHIAITPSEANALCVMAGSQFISLDLANVHVKEDTLALNLLAAPPSHTCAPGAFCGPGSPVVSNGIVAMDVAVRRPLVITAGVDCSVRVWNYVERTCESWRVFVDTPTAVSIHPSGLMVLVGFTDKLRFMNILAEDLHEIRDYTVKNCTEARFSRGGALFAIVAGNIVQVYSTLTGLYLMSLRGHSGRIVALSWAYNDATLLSTSIDGSLYEWDVREGKRARECMLKGSRPCAMAPTKDGQLVYTVGDVTCIVPPVPEDITGGRVVARNSSVPEMHRMMSVLDQSLLSPPSNSTTVSVPILREVDMSLGATTREWVLPSTTPHTGVLLSTSLPPLLFSAEGKLTPQGTPPTSSVAAAFKVPGPSGLAAVTSGGVARAVERAWSTATIPMPGSLRAYSLPLSPPLHASVNAAVLSAVIAAASADMQTMKSRRASMMSSSSASSAVTHDTMGRLIVPAYPCAGSSFPGAAAGVVRIMMSHDDAHLFLAGRDGSLIVFEVRDADGRPPVSETVGKIPWGEEIQVTTGDLDDRKAALAELRSNLAEAQGNAEHQSRVRTAAHAEELKLLGEQFVAELTAARQMQDLVREERGDVEREFSEAMAAEDAAHRTEMARREAFFQTKIMQEVDKYSSLSDTFDAMRASWASKRETAIANHAAAVARLHAEHSRRLQKIHDQQAKQSLDLEAARREQTETAMQSLTEADDESAALVSDFAARIEGEREASLRYKGENNVLRKKYSTLQRTLDEGRLEISRRLARHDTLRGTMGSLERESHVLRGIILEKEENLRERDLRTLELKTKNSELEKFKFVLDAKINELKRTVEPRELELGALKSQVSSVDDELQEYNDTNAALDVRIGALRKDIDLLLAESAAARVTLTQRTRSLEAFEKELYVSVQAAGSDPRAHVLAALRLASAHGSTAPGGVSSDVDLAYIAESLRQQEHLSNVATTLRARVHAASIGRQSGSGAIVAENSALIAQIRSLRDATAAVRGEMRALRFGKGK